MQCVILAAGAGSRIRSITPSKPMLNLHKVPLLERVINSAAEAGVTDFIIISGYNHNLINDLAKQVASKLGIKINVIFNKQWNSKANGYSALMAKDFIENKFFLLMSDHIFNPNILKEMLNIEDKIYYTALLGVDFNINNFSGDLDDATKVLVSGNHIYDIGKQIEEYNGIDTGIFLCNKAIFNALELGNARGLSSLSDSMNILSQQDELVSFNIKGKFWADIDTENDFYRVDKLLY